MHKCKIDKSNPYTHINGLSNHKCECSHEGINDDLFSQEMQQKAIMISPDSFDIKFKLLTLSPFIILLFLKLLSEHMTGVFSVLAGFLSLYYCGKCVRISNSKQIPLLHAFLACAFVFLTMTLFQLLHDNHIIKALTLQPIANQSYTASFVLWTVFLNDFFILSAVLLTKSFACLLVTQSLKRNIHLQIFDQFVQLYRLLIPITIWIFYFVPKDPKDSYAFCYFLIVAYIIFKIFQIFLLLKASWTNISILRRFVSHTFFSILSSQPPYITTFSDQALNSTCPLCVCQLSNLSVAYLTCKHAFCANCLEKWLMRFSKCPICSQAINGYNAEGLDVSTNVMPNFC